jgi:thiol-disulfide isomerase/thioredoxin
VGIWLLWLNYLAETLYDIFMTDPIPHSSKPTPQRRHLLTAGVGLAAALVGAGGAVWQANKAPAKQVEPVSGGIEDIWKMQFDTPEGGKLTMQTLRGKPLLVNFWATWCPPCVEELPLLERFYRQHKSRNMQIVGLAADKPEAVRTFLKKLPLTFPIGITDLSGIALSKSWGNQAGGLPFSVMLAADGQVMQRKIGILREDDLKIWLEATR